MNVFLIQADDGCLSVCSTREIAEQQIELINEELPPAKVDGVDTLWIEEFTVDAFD